MTSKELLFTAVENLRALGHQAECVVSTPRTTGLDAISVQLTVNRAVFKQHSTGFDTVEEGEEAVFGYLVVSLLTNCLPVAAHPVSLLPAAPHHESHARNREIMDLEQGRLSPAAQVLAANETIHLLPRIG